MHVLIPHHLIHLAELVPVTLPQYSLQICHQHIYRSQSADMFTTWYSVEVQKQMELGNSTNEVVLRLSILKPLHATWLVSLYNHLTAGGVGKWHIAKGWNKAGISELIQGKTTIHLKTLRRSLSKS